MSWLEVGDFSINHTLTDSYIVTNEREVQPPPPPSPWEFKTLFYYLVAGPYLYATASTLKHSYPKFTKDQQQNIE